MTRFSRKSVLESLGFKIEAVEKEYGFKPDLGYWQVAGKGEKINREFGAYMELIMLYDAIEWRSFPRDPIA